MEATKVINLIEKIEKPVKLGEYTTYSSKRNKKQSRGKTIVNAPSSVSKAKVDSIYDRFEKLRIKTVDDLHKSSKVFVTVQ